MKLQINLILQASVESKKQTDGGKGFRLQNIRIADSTGSMRATLFGDQVDTLEKGKTYFFKDLKKKDFQKRMYLEVASSGPIITVAHPINDECDQDISEDEEEVGKRIVRTLSGNELYLKICMNFLCKKIDTIWLISS